MDDGARKEIEKRVNAGEDPAVIKSEYVAKGFLENELDNVLGKKAKPKSDPNAGKYAAKDFFDTVGYGFSSQQFINIFFLQSGAGIFLIGIINAVKTLLSVFTSTVVQSYHRNSAYNKRVAIIAGILFSLSMILLGVSLEMKNYWAFSALILISGVLVAIFGDFYLKLRDKSAGNAVMRFLSKYGLIVTAAALIITGFSLDNIPYLAISGMHLNNSFLVLGISALAFLLGILIFALARPEQDVTHEHDSVFPHIYGGLAKIKIAFQAFMKDKLTAIMITSSILVASVQVLGNSYFGIYIFQNASHPGLGNYMSVALVFTVAALTSLFGPLISRINARAYGKFPMLAFGTTFMAIMPLTYYYNPNIISISMGTIVGVIGGAIAGVAHGLLINDLLHETERQNYFSSLGLLSTVPYIITAPIGAYIAYKFGLPALFLALGIVLLAVVFLYFSVVWLHRKHKTMI
ncbi:MAG: Drug resistance transporter, Bcr/CflA subfamily [archaeon GW2011_AR3]|nr:MAG: Drug resistance transporter, Bcr/CflA subfamily [archaeon GW2011_AR3]MBS3109903.1 hypothetical protein [Candidatus Woesearchaeota archaeon]